jgi:hypothetical protein
MAMSLRGKTQPKGGKSKKRNIPKKSKKKGTRKGKIKTMNAPKAFIS